MNDATKKSPQRCLVLRAEFDASYGRFGHIGGFVSHVNTSNKNGFEGEMYGKDSEILKLSIWSQTSDNSTEMYSLEIGRQAHRHVDLHEAKHTIALLAPIHRKIDKLATVEGHPRTFGQRINRIARAIGAVKVFTFSDKWDHGHRGWRESSIGDAVYAVDCLAQEVVDWCNELKKQKEAA